MGSACDNLCQGHEEEPPEEQEVEVEGSVVSLLCLPFGSRIIRRPGSGSAPATVTVTVDVENMTYHVLTCRKILYLYVIKIVSFTSQITYGITVGRAPKFVVSITWETKLGLLIYSLRSIHWCHCYTAHN